MIFKTLVECILKRTHDPDDSLSLNAMHTLTREIKYDLTQAFALSRPLVDRHETLFLESNSYFDFLLKISNLPFYKDFYSRRFRPEDVSANSNVCELKTQLEDCRKENEDCRKENEDCRKQLEDYRKQLEDCRKQLEDCQKQLEDCQKQLHDCQKENEKTKNERDEYKYQLDQCQTELSNTKVSLEKCENENDKLKKELCSSDEKLDNLRKEGLTLNEKCTNELNSLEQSQRNDQLILCKNLIDENSKLQTYLNHQKEYYEAERIGQWNSYNKTLNELQKKHTDLESQYQFIYKSAENLHQQLIMQTAQNQQIMGESEIVKQNSETLHRIMGNMKNAIEYNQKVAEYILAQQENASVIEPDQNAGSSVSLDRCNMKAIELPLPQILNTDESIKESDSEESMNESYDGLPCSPIRANVRLKKDEELTNCQQLLETTKKELTECQEEKEKYMKQFQEIGQYENILKIIKTRYEFHNLPSSLECDLKMADTFKSQIKKIEKEAYLVRVIPEEFADYVLTLHLHSSKHAENLKKITEVAKLDDDKHFVQHISHRLKVYDSIMRLSNRYFPPADVLIWISSLDIYLDNLAQSLTDLSSDSKDKLATNTSGWLQYALYKIKTVFRNFVVCDEMIKELQKLLPDITIQQMDTDEKEFNVITKCDFKNELVKRYIILKDFASSLLGTGSIENLSSLMAELQTKSKIEKDNWLYEYIQVLEKKSSVALDLQEECKKVASHFQISFNQGNFYNLIIESIITNLKGEFDRYSIPVENFNDVSSDFQTLMQQVMKTAVEYVVERNESEWVKHYNEWISELYLDTGTTREEFLNALQAYKYREKRSFDTSAEGECVEKRVKLEDNWTHLDMQNIFAALYTEYFKLKWKYLSNVIPLQEEIQERIERKLAFLETTPINPRGSVITKCLIDYVKVDLLLWNAKPDLFPEIVSISQILKTSMDQTEKYLLTLINKDHYTNA